MGSTRLKLGYGKSFHSSCICIGNFKEIFCDLKAIEKYLNKYGQVKKMVQDHEQKTALCFFETREEANKAVDDLKAKMINGRRVEVELASRDFQTYFMEHKIAKPNETNSHGRGRSGSWMSANSVDYDERSSYDRNRNTSLHHHHQSSSSRSSSSSLCQVRSNNNNSVSSSYSSMRQRSQSPSSPTDNLTPFSNSFNPRHSSLTQSTLHGGNTNRISSKYEYHHDSSNSCRSSSRPSYSRYESPADDVDDVDDESHLSSSSKRDSRYSSSRSHYMSENFLSDASPKIRRDSSPYGSSYSNSSKLDSDVFHRSNRGSTQNDEIKSSSHDDGHGSLRRAVHSSSKIYNKNCRDVSPTSHVSQYRKTGLSSSSSSTSSNSRSPIRDAKSSSHYQDRTSSVSPPASPRAIPYSSSYHESERQTHSTLSDANNDHQSQSWRRKSTEDTSCHRDHQNSISTSDLLQRARSDSVSDVSDSNFSLLNNSSHRDLSRDYFRDRFRESHHRTNSITSTTLAYQNRNDSVKRKTIHSSLVDSVDENSSDLPGHLERKKRLLACVEQSSTTSNSSTVAATNNSSVSSIHTGSLSSSNVVTNSSVVKSNVEPRITSSKSLDSSSDLKLHLQKSRESTNSLDNSSTGKRRPSNSSLSSNTSQLLNCNDAASDGGNTSFKDLKPIFEHYLAEGKLSETQASAVLTLLQDQSKSQVNRNLLNSTSSSSCNVGTGLTSSLTTINSTKPKTKDGCPTQTSLRIVDVTSPMVNHSIGDRRLSGHNARYNKISQLVTRTNCDNDLNNKNSKSSETSQQRTITNLEFGPSSPWNLPLPEFAIPPQLKSSTVGNDQFKSHTSTSIVITSSTTSTTSTLSTLTSTSASGTNITHIPNLTNTTTSTITSISSTSPKTANIMSPLGNLSPVPKNRFSRDNRLSTETNSFDFNVKSKSSNDLDDVSDSDLGTLMIEDKIKALDEKYNAWSGTASTAPTMKSEKTPTIDYSKYNIKKKSQSNSSSNSNSALLSNNSNSNEHESTDKIKNILSTKSSVFDQDSKRLEHLNEKYEQKDVSASLDFDSIGSHKILSSSRPKFPNNQTSAISNPLVMPTEKIIQNISLDPLPTTSTSSSSTPTPNISSSSSSSSLFHSSHHNHNHHSSSSSSSTNAIPTSSSSISRKISESSRTNQIKKDHLLGTSTSLSSPTAPGSAPVRSSSSMFPQFSRSSSIPTSSTTPNTPTSMSSASVNSSRPPLFLLNSAIRKECSSVSNNSANQSVNRPTADVKYKIESISKSSISSAGKSLDGGSLPNINNKIASSSLTNNSSCKSDHQSQAKRDHSLTKSCSLPDQSSQNSIKSKHDISSKNEFSYSNCNIGNNISNNINKKEMERKNSNSFSESSSGSHNNNNESCGNGASHHHSLKDHIKLQKSIHSNKESSLSKDEQSCKKQQQQQTEKEKTVRESKSEMSSPPISKEKNNSKKCSNSSEMILSSNNKDKEKIKKKNKEKEYSNNHHQQKDNNKEQTNQKQTDQQSSKQRSKLSERRESTKEKMKNFQESSSNNKEKKKDKRKESKEKNKENKNKLFELDDEPIYFSMYDKVKARSSANQSLKVAKTGNDHLDNVRQKLNQLKDKRHNRNKDDDDDDDDDHHHHNKNSKSSEDSDEDSDSSFDRNNFKQKKLMKKRRAIVKSDSSSDEDDDDGDEESFSHVSMSLHHSKKLSKKLLVNDDDDSGSEMMESYHNNVKENKLKKSKREQVNKFFTDDSSDSSATEMAKSSFQHNKMNKSRISNNKISDVDESSAEDSSTLTKFTKKRKKLKKDKDKEKFGLSNSSNSKDKHELVENQNKLKDHHSKYNKKNKIQEKQSSLSSHKETSSIQEGKIKSANEKEKRPFVIKSDDDGDFVSQKMTKCFSNSSSGQKKKKKKSKSSSKEKRHCSPMKDGFAKDSNRMSTMNKLKHEIFSDDNESSDASAMTNSTSNNRKQRSRNHWKLTDSESEPTMHQIFKSCKEYKDETRDARMVNTMNKSLYKMDKQQANKQSIKHEMMAAMMMENIKMKDDRFSKNNKINSKSSFSMINENQKISKYDDSNCDSMKENVSKKKKKSSKSKDKEKIRKDSASNDSSDKTSNHSSYDQRHPCKSSMHFNELNLFLSMSSPPSSNQDANSCRSGSNLLDPSKSSILIASPPPKTPEISSPRSSPSHYVENIIISHVDDESSYIDSKIDEDLINESQTILRHCNENSSSDSCLSDSIVHDSVSPTTSHTNDFNIMLSVQTSFGQLVKPGEISGNDPYSTKSPSPFEQKHRSCEDEVAIQSLKLQKELETVNSKCVESKIDIMHHSFLFSPFDTTNNQEKTNIEKLSFRSSSPISSKSDDNQTTTIFNNAEGTEHLTKISMNEEHNKCNTEFNSEIECQRKIEDDLAVAALLQDMNDPCAMEEPNITQSGEIESNNSHHELPIPSFLNIISPNNSESVVLQQSVDNRPVVMEVSDSTGTVTSAGDHQTVVTDVVVVDDQELEAAVQEIEFVAQDTIKEEVVVVKPNDAPIVISPIPLTVDTCDDAIMFNDDDDNVEHELVVDENVLDKSLQEDLPDMSPTDIHKHDTNAEPVSNVKEFVSFSADQVKTSYLKSPSHSITDDLNASESTITIEIEHCLTNVQPQNMFSETILTKSSTTVVDESLAKSSPQSDENQKTTQLSMPILTAMDNDNKEAPKLDIFMSPRGQHQNIEQQQIAKSNEAQLDKDSVLMETYTAEPKIIHEDTIEKIDNSLFQNMDVEGKSSIGKEENLSSGNEDTPMITESCLNKSNKRAFDELEIDTSNENTCSKPKRGRKAKNRKNSDSSLHSPRSEQGQNESTPLSTTLSINTNLPVTNAALLSPTSQSPVASSYSSDISPGSQTKRGKQQHTTGYNIFSSVRRSVRTAAVTASAVNSTTLEELEDTDYSMDEQQSNKEEHEDDTKNGVKKQSKRGRKKKNSGNADASNIKTDDTKKPLLTVSNASNTNRPKSSISPYDVFEFTDDEDQGPLTLDHIKPPHFMSSMTEDKHHFEKRHQNENAENTCPTLTTVKQENIIETQQSGPLVPSGGVSKEYVSEVNPSGKLVIRLQDSAIGVSEGKPTKDEIKSSEECSSAITSSLVPGDNNNAQSIKSVRKSARLMSQGTKISTEDDEMTLKNTKLSNETTNEKGNCKRVTRSYRKSDDAQHSGNATGSQDSSDDQDESKTSLRAHRITRSKGGSSSAQEQTNDLEIKNDPDVGSADESTFPETLTTIPCQELPQEESNAVSTQISLEISEPSISHPVTSSVTVVQSTPEYHPLVINAPIAENKKSESTSVIQSTGNVEKILTPDVTITTTATTSIIVPLSTPSTLTNISPVITNSSTVVVSNSPSTVITSTLSPNYNLQDIPNISDRIHHSPYTPVKLKTGKGLIFDNFKAPIIVSGHDNSQQQQSKVTESLTSTPNVQSVMIKPKYQHPVGQAAEIRPKSPINIPTSSSVSVVINDPIKNECHISSPSAITPPSMADSIKNLSSQSSHSSVPIVNKTFTQNKSVLQVAGSSNAQTQDLNLPYPGNLLPSTSPHHLTSTISSDVFNIQSQQQKDYLSSLQKQQIITNNNRSTNQKSDSISEFITSSLNNNDLPPSTQTTNHQMPNPAFAATMSQIKPPVTSANLYDYEMAMHNSLIWSNFSPGIPGIPLTAHRFIYPGPAFLPPGINPEQVEQQAQQTKSKASQQKEGLHRPSFIEEPKLHPGQEQPFTFDMSGLGSASQRNYPINPNLRHFSQLIAPHDSPTYLQYGLNGQGRNFSMPPLNYGGLPNNTEISKQLQSQSPSIEQKRPSSKPSITIQDTAIYSSNPRPLPSPAHSPAYRKEMPAELNAEILRNQMTNQFSSSKESVRSSSPPLNMSYQRVLSPNLPQPLSRPSSECSVEQATITNIKRTSNAESSQITPPPVTNSVASSHVIPQNGPNYPSNSSNTSQHVILQRHPMLWQGLLTLKNEQAAVQMHYVCGNRNVAVQALPFLENNSASLRITQRMRFEPSQLQSLENKIQSKDECCILLALPCGRDQVDVLTQSNNLRKYFITYLQSKLAAGIVNDSAGYITHIFPPCDFSEQHLVQTAPDMLHHLSGISHLMVVITTTTNSTNHV
uniref:Uncharacterized protein LOC113797582 n=1 Tax=Dermatophagoides pteronyssinus TaxID=6956 RepID=A0A6P6YEW6_DERPT|nr:uncharacterized protein LOC113797582 [Dermatophagoides pteronyssinus]